MTETLHLRAENGIVGYFPVMPMTQSERPEIGDEGLELQAQHVLAAVRLAIQGVLGRLPIPPQRPRDLEQALRLHKTLAWRIMRVAHGRDPLSDVQHLPGAEGVEIFLDAARALGVAEELLEAVRQSVARFRSLAEAHAGDRQSLEVMLRSLVEAAEPAADLRAARRSAFRCTTYTWGTQTRVRLLSCFVTPSGGGLAEIATLRAHVGMRRVRRNAMLGLSRTVENNTDEPGPRIARVEAVEPEGVVGGVPLLRDFCTNPLPEAKAVSSKGGNVDYQFADTGIGLGSALTVYTAEVRRGLSGCLKRDPANTMNAFFLTVRQPWEIGIVDLWAPRGAFGDSRPYGLCVSAITGEPTGQPPAAWWRLPMPEVAERLGRGLDAAPIAEAPEYQGAAGRVFQRLKWEPMDYELHRLRVEYPVMGTSLVMAVDLPE